MQTFKVLGSGCKKCNVTAEMIQQKADALGLSVKVEKVTDMAEIMGYGVMSTPGVVLNETVVHSGSVPSAKQVEGWLKG
ncbi:MAG: thioredoxin family protein [Rhodobacterales bacterium]|nr:MAG: thioredoxin family protein [Rhodobacterales bacterium]